MQVSQILKENVLTLNKQKQQNVKTLNVDGNEVKRIAHYLAEKLNDYSSLNYFCKVAWTIPEYQLMNFLENAQKPNVRDPRRVFAWQCQQAINIG